MSDDYGRFVYWQQFPRAVYRRIELIQADPHAKASEHQNTSLCRTTLTAMITRRGHRTRRLIDTMCNLDPADETRYAWTVSDRHHHPYWSAWRLSLFWAPALCNTYARVVSHGCSKSPCIEYYLYAALISVRTTRRLMIAQQRDIPGPTHGGSRRSAAASAIVGLLLSFDQLHWSGRI